MSILFTFWNPQRCCTFSVLSCWDVLLLLEFAAERFGRSRTHTADCCVIGDGFEYERYLCCTGGLLQFCACLDRCFVYRGRVFSYGWFTRPVLPGSQGEYSARILARRCIATLLLSRIAPVDNSLLSTCDTAALVTSLDCSLLEGRKVAVCSCWA